MNFLEYAENGRVLQAYHSCQEPPPAPWGGTVIETEMPLDPGTHIVVGGVPVDIGPRPSALHVIDYDAQEWRLPGDLTELRVARDAKWLQIKRKRDELEAGGFPYFGKIVDSDKLSVQRIALAVQSAQAAISAGAAFGIEWTCADNSTIQLDGPAMAGMPVALAEHANSLHVIARELRAAIYAEDATEESVAAISWPS